MIVITGATGHLGGAIVEGLLERVPAGDVAVSVRDPARARGFADRGVTVRRGDFTDPASLRDAFADASQVLLVSLDRLGREAIDETTGAVDAAYRAGAERVLYTSHQAADPESLFAPALDHAAVEAHLERVGRPYTALRNGYYATTSLRAHVGDAAGSGELVAPADGPVAWTAPADLAEAAAAILAGEARFDGPTPPLVADPVDLAEVAARLSDITGRTVRRVVIDDDDYVARLVAAGTPEPFARIFLDSFRASRRGEFDVSDPTLAELLGRAPRSVDDALRTIVAG